MPNRKKATALTPVDPSMNLSEKEKMDVTLIASFQQEAVAGLKNRTKKSWNSMYMLSAEAPKQIFDGRPFIIEKEETGDIYQRHVNVREHKYMKDGYDEEITLKVPIQDGIKDVFEEFRLTEFDFLVLCALGTLYEHLSNKNDHQETIVVTNPDIYCALTGKVPNRVSRKLEQDIYASIQRLSSVRIWRSMTTQNARQVNHEVNVAMLLAESGRTRRHNGKEVNCYILYAEPRLYKYACETGNILTIPFGMINVPTISNTAGTIPLIGYLVRNICLEKRKRNKKSISFNISRIYEIYGATTPDAQYDVRSTIIPRIMEYWKSQECDRLISAFEWRRRVKNEITELIIHL